MILCYIDGKELQIMSIWDTPRVQPDLPKPSPMHIYSNANLAQYVADFRAAAAKNNVNVDNLHQAEIIDFMFRGYSPARAWDAVYGCVCWI